jgi:SIR2-like domain
MSDSFHAHVKRVAKAIAEKEVVFFLGAGANLCGRPAGVEWKPRGHFLPNGAELAAYLAEKFDYPPEETPDLLRVAQYAELMSGMGPLYKRLHHLFNADYDFTSLHNLLATLPATLSAKGYPPHILVVTTNYDDVLERAFKKAGVEFDLVTYMSDNSYQKRSWCIHIRPGVAEPEVISTPNAYYDISLKERSAILKIHGAVDRVDAARDSYVITEDDYINYLTHTDISSLVPVNLVRQLKNCSFLFLGYSLRDWNLRAILRRIWSQQELGFKSWAIQLNPDPLETMFWDKREVDIINIRLDDYIPLLDEQLQALPPAGD